MLLASGSAFTGYQFLCDRNSDYLNKRRGRFHLYSENLVLPQFLGTTSVPFPSTASPVRLAWFSGAFLARMQV